MPVLDDRLWSHPKWASLSDAGFRAGIIGLSYAHEHITRGHLSEETLTFLGVRTKVRNELVTRHVWDGDPRGDGVQIHDCSDYNDDDEHERRRALGRERSRRWRERHASRNGPGNASPNASQAASPRARARVLEEEEEVKDPLTPAERGNSDASRTSPRAAGTNPRAVADRDRADRHRHLIAAGVAIADALEQMPTDLFHEQLDLIERETHSTFTDQERSRIVDHYLNRWTAS